MKDGLSKEFIDSELIDIYTESRIIRDKHTKSASLEINASCEWRLFEGDSMDTINLNIPIARGKDKGIYPLYSSPSKRSYFKLETYYSSAILAEKPLPMEGGYNFRDLGGLQSKNGKHIRWGSFFRSDDLYHLSEEDLNYLSSIPIATIIDFRCQEEYSALPDKFPESLKNYYNLSINPGSLRAFAKSKVDSKEKMIEAMKNLYRLFITESEYVATYREFFRLLQNEKELPLLFHCSAGKDRTGLAATLLLFALDIPKDTIMQDYMLSNLYLADKYESLFKDNPANKYLYTILPEYLETALKEIDKRYGNMNIFLEKEMKINTQILQEKYLF